MSDWYARLMEYFPKREMKTKNHFEILFHEKKGNYKLEESQDYILVYLEEADYIFVDYILVVGSSRGKGTGSLVLEQLKQKGKAIILEVEPVTLIDPDSEKRRRFYEKNDFIMMNGIQYERIHMVTKELNKMDVFVWTPLHRTEQWMYDRMKDVYEGVHAYKSRELYGCNPQPVSDVLWMKELTYNKA